jgi:hypothetical protein
VPPPAHSRAQSPALCGLAYAVGKIRVRPLEGNGSAYHPCCPAYRKYAVGDDFDTCSWDPGRGPRRALYHHVDHVEDGLSKCETVSACLDYDGNGNHFDVDTDIDFAGGRSG